MSDISLRSSGCPEGVDSKASSLSPMMLVGLVIASSVFHVLFVVSPHTLEWTTNQDIPFVLRWVDPGFNPGDFFTNASEDAPRIGFAIFVRSLMALGMDWELAFYTLKTAVILVRPVLMFFILVKLAEHVLTPLAASRLMGPAALIAAAYAATMYQTDTWYMIAGWDQIHTNDAISPMGLAATLLLGALLVLLWRQDRYGVLAVGALFLLAGWVHPVVTLCAWAWFSILFIGLNWSLTKGVRLAVALLPFAVAPALIMQALYAESSVISPEAYRDIYVTWRHPMHFDMAYAVGEMRGLPILALLMLLGAFFVRRTGHWRLGTMLGLMFLFPVAALVLQYTTTNLMAVSIFVSLGPSRALNLFVPFLLFGLMLAGMHWAGKRHGHGSEPPRNPITTVTPIQGALAVGAALLTAIPVGWINLERGVSDTQTRELVEWISTNTDQDDVIADMNLVRDRPLQGGYFEPNIVSSAVRVHAERAVYYDKTFPYRRAAAANYKARHDLNRALVGLSMNDFACTKGTERIDYAYYDHRHPAVPNDDPVFRNERFSVFAAPETCTR